MEDLIKVYNNLDCEFEIFENNKSLYKSKNIDFIKEESNKIEKNLIKWKKNYYEYSKKNIDNYSIELYLDVTKYQNAILMLKEDSLTTLPNRYAIDLFLNNHVNDNYVTVIFDLDDFKYINDTFGHVQGDIVLNNLGIILKRLLSQNIFVGRYGGEEFVVFFRNASIKQVILIMKEIRNQIENNDNLTNDKYKIKLSVGMACIDETKSLTDSIKEADMALYYVKNNGKNADAIYDSETNHCYIVE